MDPLMATLAAAEPVIEPTIVEDATAALAVPPGRLPTSAMLMAEKKSAAPERMRKAPKTRNRNICEAST